MPLIISIDGPAGSGKSTVAKRLAWSLGLPYIDTGAMYRSVAFKALEEQIDLENEAALTKIAEGFDFYFSMEDGNSVVEVVELSTGKKWRLGPEVRSPKVSMASSRVAGFKELRRVLVRKQQECGKARGGVLEGRDAGTVIFPDADIKFFLTASAEARAERRYRELQRRMGAEAPNYEQVLAEVNQRDEQDETREASPLKAAEDAQWVDTTELSEDSVYSLLLKKVQESSGISGKSN